MESLPFTMPSPKLGGAELSWNGREFVVGNEHHRILSYETGASGWSEELTLLHEEETSGGSHFIDVASRARAVAALQRYLPAVPHPTILEVGVSGGHLLADLVTEFPNGLILGADYTLGTLQSIAPRFEGIPLIQIDLTKSPFPPQQMDAIVLLNVLEHIDHDHLAVAHCFRMLRPGGILVIEVPAGPTLYDDYDKELMHFRRYRGADLTKMLTAAGFDLEEASHIGFLLYPAFWLSKKRNQARAIKTSAENARVRQAIRNTSRIGVVGHAIMKAEQWLSKRVNLPVGIRCTAIGRKPGP